MFLRTRKHINILVSRYGASVYQDGRYIHIDVKLSIKSSRDRTALRDVMNTINDLLELVENPRVMDIPGDTEIVGPQPTKLDP